MRHDEFEAKMFSRVNENSKMKELDRAEVARAAAEEYRYVSKCKKINAVIGIIVLTVCFGTTVFALQAMNLTGFLPSAWAIGIWPSWDWPLAWAFIPLAAELTINRR